MSDKIKNFFGSIAQTSFTVLLLVLVVAILAWGTYGQFISTTFGIGQLEFIIGLTLAGFFPVSAVTYIIFLRRAQLRKLARDFWLLGIDIRGELDQLLERSDITDKQREELLRGPGAWEPEHYSIYLRYLEGRSYVWLNYVIQSVWAVLGTIFGLSLFAWLPQIELGDFTNSIIGDNSGVLTAMQFGFVGAYIYAVQLVYRRFTTLDLQPSVYMNCTLTMLAGIAFNFVAFKAIGNVAGNQSVQNASGLTGGLVAIISFSLGYFPYLAINWFNRLGHSALGVRDRRADSLPLGLIDGISQYHETRLRDEGVDNVQNLAAVGLDELLMNTRFSAQQLIEWVDQAVLYLYLDPNEVESFRRGRIRSFSDFQDHWKPYIVAYYLYGEPAKKLIWLLRRNMIKIDEFRARLEVNGRQEFERFFNQFQLYNLDNMPVSVPADPKNPQQQNSKAIRQLIEEERKAFALQLQTTPERLDALFIATEYGPNVAHIKNYWKRAEDLQLNIQKIQEEQVRKGVITGVQAFAKRVELGSQPRDKATDRLATATTESDPTTWSTGAQLLTAWRMDDWGLDSTLVADAMVGEARLSKHLGQVETALNAYQSSINHSPDRCELLNEAAWFLVGELPVQNYPVTLAQLENAEQMATRAVRLARQKNNSAQLFAALDTVAVAKIRLAERAELTDEKQLLLSQAEQYLKQIDPTQISDEHKAIVDSHLDMINQMRAQLTGQGDSVPSNSPADAVPSPEEQPSA